MWRIIYKDYVRKKFRYLPSCTTYHIETTSELLQKMHRAYQKNYIGAKYYRSQYSEPVLMMQSRIEIMSDISEIATSKPYSSPFSKMWKLCRKVVETTSKLNIVKYNIQNLLLQRRNSRRQSKLDIGQGKSTCQPETLQPSEGCQEVNHVSGEILLTLQKLQWTC